GQPDIAGDLPQQRRRDVAAFVHWNGGAASVGMAILDVRTALAHIVETQPFEQATNFDGFKDGNRTHTQATAMLCVPTNSASNFGSPSSSSMAITSRRLA